jgi:hypothetical protein
VKRGRALVVFALGATALAAACGSDHADSSPAGGTGGTSGTVELASAGAPPDPAPFCAQVCRLEAAVDCSSGVAVAVEGDPDVPVDEPSCVEDWCEEDPTGIANPAPQKSCEREWAAYVECSANQTSDAYGCYGPFHTSVDPYLCAYPELEDYDNCRSSGGSEPYPAEE